MDNNNCLFGLVAVVFLVPKLSAKRGNFCSVEEVNVTNVARSGKILPILVESIPVGWKQKRERERARR